MVEPIVIERVVDAPVAPETAAQRIAAFATSAGYAPEAPGIPVFRRGSALGSLIAIGPRNWGSRIAASIFAIPGGVRVAYRFDVDTLGQIVTEMERRVFETEADRPALAISTGTVDAGAGLEAARLSTLRSYGLIAIILGALFLVPGTAVLILSAGIALFCAGPLMIVGGALLAFGIWKIQVR